MSLEFVWRSYVFFCRFGCNRVHLHCTIMVRQRKVTHSSENTSVQNKSMKDDEGIKNVAGEDGRLERLFGVQAADFGSWKAFVSLLSRPCDPSSLALLRIVYGFLMMLDIPFERGLAHADYIFGDPAECRFPLFDFLQPLTLPWMYMVYLVLFIGSVGIMLGCMFRTSCLLYLVSYWYLYLLDKTTWNNHSYLYGLCAFLLLLSDANRYWSVDGMMQPKIKNNKVPLWNYTLFRTQFFLVYFIAGLKKMDPDWVLGYSMQSLSHHWIFSPFTYILTYDQIDLFVVHHGGLIYDTSVGFLLFFDATRPLGVSLSVMFHTMNAQMFTIGMFPYVMLATLPIFSTMDWPKRLVSSLPLSCQSLLPSTAEATPSKHCILPAGQNQTSPAVRPGPRCTQHVAAVFTLAYISVQCFLPYSHFLTLGYNTWTNGLYGYSWDMMVHNWATQHISITYVDRETGQTGFLKPNAWTRSHLRWSSHSDMIKQYAHCIQDRLRGHGINDVELYFDVWRSLNDRFQQRMFDPHVDVIRAPWSPWAATPWQMPLLADLTHWRKKLDEIETQLYDSSNDIDIVFMADFPGLKVENFLQSELGNATIQILEGSVIVELVSARENHTLHVNDTMQLPSGEFHYVYTISATPSCFMYQYVNTTEQRLQTELHNYEDGLANGKKHTDDPKMADLYQHVQERRNMLMAAANSSSWQRLGRFFSGKVKDIARSATMTGIALKSLTTGQSFQAVFNMTIKDGQSWMF